MEFLRVSKEEDYNFADDVDYEVIDTQNGIVQTAQILLKERLLAVDTENTGIDPHLGNPLILQIGTSSKCYVFPAFLGLDFSPLKEVLENKDIIKVLFNAMYDYKWIYVKYGISMENIFCCQVAERLLTMGKPNAMRRTSLAYNAEKYLGITIKKALRNNFINRDPIADPITESEYAYSAADVVILPDIFFQQSLLLEQNGLSQAIDIENGVLPVFAEMEVLGILIDRKKWESLLEEANRRMKEIAGKIFKEFAPVVAQHSLFGNPTFNLNSREKLLEYFKKLGFELPDTEEDTLKKFKGKHPVFSLISDYRGYSKIVSTYGEKILQKINRITGRLHPSFNQLGADTSRASSNNPNGQNIPGYDEDDPESLNFRSCFIARPGYKIITADYSQQEIRVLADLSGDPVLIKAFTTKDKSGKDFDIHSYTASVVFGIPYDKVNKKGKERRMCKTLNFFLVYGGGANALAETLEITKAEAEQVIADYFKRYPKIKKALDKWAYDAIRLGYSESISGHKRYLPLPPEDHPDYEKIKASIKRKGMNNPIQSSSGSVTKMGMIYCRRALKDRGYDARILMAIHDELVVEVREDQAEEVSKMVQETMIAGFSHFFKKVPMKVDAGISYCWEK